MYATVPDGSKIRIRGFISNQPYHIATKQIVRMGRFFVQTEPFPRFQYGDSIVVTGTLGKRVTEYGMTDLWLMYPEISFLTVGEDGSIPRTSNVLLRINRFRQTLERNLAQILPDPQASLLVGILLGVKNELPDDFATALRRTGTMHVVVASGYNVTVIAGIMSRILFIFFSRRKAIPMLLVAIAIYTVLAGAEPPIVRAASMGMLVLVAQLLGRQYTSWWALMLTGGLMLLSSPMLVFDLGFQLSFAATAGILTIAQPLIEFLRRPLGIFGRVVLENLSITLGAQLAVLPLLLLHFGSVSWLSPLTNVIIALLIPLIMELGMGLVVLVLLWKELAIIGGMLSWLPLTAFVSIVTWFDALPFGRVRMATVTWWWVIGYYLVFGLIVWRLSRSRKMGVGVPRYGWNGVR